MSVSILIDSAAGLPLHVAEELGIYVADLHVMEGQEATTSGLSALELAALYGRLLERSGDAGVLAIHLSKELSSTWSAAASASGAFEDTVQVVDSGTAGMVMGVAAVAAARAASDGASLQECHAAASTVLDHGNTWLYVHSMEELRRSGRMSAATALSTALLATKPILSLSSGKLELVGKTRTQSKAFHRLVDIVTSRAGGAAAFVAIQYAGDVEPAERLRAQLEESLPDESSCVLLPLSKALAVHVGPGAIGVSVVCQESYPQAKNSP